MYPCLTTPGLSTLAMAWCSGTTSGRPRAVPTSGIAAWGCTATGSTSRRPDDYLVSLDAKTGKERWHKVISDFNEQYFSTIAPIVIGNHLLVGTADDLDAPGFLQSFDPDTGDLQWKWYSEPEKMGDPGSETWPNLDSMRHGGAGHLGSRKL